MEPNDMQIGGSHYRKKYQHWDWVCDTRMPYLLACATKYVSRHQDKNGIEDLLKATHYLTKAESRSIYMPRNKWWEFPLLGLTFEKLIRARTLLFTNQLETKEASIIRLIIGGSYDRANDQIAELIDDITFPKVDKDYTNQDPDYIRG